MVSDVDGSMGSVHCSGASRAAAGASGLRLTLVRVQPSAYRMFHASLMEHLRCSRQSPHDITGGAPPSDSWSGHGSEQNEKHPIRKCIDHLCCPLLVQAGFPDPPGPVRASSCTSGR